MLLIPFRVMGSPRFIFVACLVAASPWISFAADPSQNEEWSLRKIHATPISSELPQGGSVISRNSNNEYGAVTPGRSMWGQQLTLQAWPTGSWNDSIRLDYYIVDVPGRSPGSDEWSYGLSDHTARDADPQTPWAAPKIEKRLGYRVYETARDLTVFGEKIVNADYNVELGPGRSFRLSLSCRKASFKRYAPYYVRIRDTLVLPKRNN